MAEPFIGEIRLFPFNFAPEDWAQCDGQILEISDNTALYSLVGTKYGGNGTTTFALPDYRGRVPFNWGNPGWAAFPHGAKGGVETHTLSQVPVHNHDMYVQRKAGDENEPEGNMIASEIEITASDTEVPFAGTSDTHMHPGMVANTGNISPVPFNNIQPVTALNFCIALKGIYPPRS
ncbi:phage tail protein [Kordiimonas laminariae]|uniref:phage tail protein n=1 Tax=Kordiimonas laminariae TaxID=2917717 RepID=UPI001FF468EF|nr:tail fiber protein [Kordiimonas laminariae]MCK0071158.1 tail fiber protein [Kordiimonas laminariae]